MTKQTDLSSFDTVPWEDPEVLRREYVEKNRSIESLAKDYFDGRVPVAELRDTLDELDYIERSFAEQIRAGKITLEDLGMQPVDEDVQKMTRRNGGGCANV